MTTINIDTRQQQSFVYPHFHDTQSKRKSTKEIEIDNSVYHLLSLYLNTDTLLSDKNSLLLSNSLHKKQHSPQLPYNKSNRTTFRTKHRNWFGEEQVTSVEKNHSQQDLLLLSNTRKNSTIKPLLNEQEEKTIKINKKRSKSVSFNENVVVIISQDEKTISQLKQQLQQNEEEIFVDALEYIS